MHCGDSDLEDKQISENHKGTYIHLFRLVTEKLKENKCNSIKNFFKEI